MKSSRAVILALVLLPLAGDAVSGQTLARPGSPAAARIERTLAETKAPALGCSVQPYPTRLLFDFRLWSGFRASIPARQFSPSKSQVLLAVFRVTPESGGAPAYFWHTYAMPELPPGPGLLKKIDLVFDGGFFLGPGRYSVDWLAVDAADRVCRSTWRVKAAAKENVTIPPNTATDSFLDTWSGFSASGAPPRRVAIFLHADAVERRRYRARLSPWDRAVLLDSLKAFLDKSPFTEASLAVFNLDRREVLFEEPNLEPQGYERLATILGNADNATVDYGTLVNGPTPGQFLSELVRGATKGEQRPAAIVFIGPGWRMSADLRFDSRGLREDLPPVFQIAFVPYRWLPQDTVTDFVRKLKGKVLTVQEPSNLAAAIREINGAATRTVTLP